MTDANEIARRLTKAQREAVKRGFAWSTVTARKMLDLRLASFFARYTGENYVRVEWTTLGLAVKRALEQGEVG